MDQPHTLLSAGPSECLDKKYFFWMGPSFPAARKFEFYSNFEVEEVEIFYVAFKRQPSSRMNQSQTV